MIADWYVYFAGLSWWGWLKVGQYWLYTDNVTINWLRHIKFTKTTFKNKPPKRDIVIYTSMC